VKITLAGLIAAGLQPTQARIFEAPLQLACERFAIDASAGRLAAFLANAGHESRNFTRLEEDLFYRSAERIRAVFPSRVRDLAEAAALVGRPQALANRVYAGKLGNGPEDSGDGWRFRGRGLFQLTGRGNYRSAAVALKFDYELSPDLVAMPHHAALTAAWFWQSIGGNVLADARQIDAITRRINGPAMLAAEERRERYEQGLQAFA
jgi:putative chitinase